MNPNYPPGGGYAPQPGYAPPPPQAPAYPPPQQQYQQPQAPNYPPGGGYAPQPGYAPPPPQAPAYPPPQQQYAPAGYPQQQQYQQPPQQQQPAQIPGSFDGAKPKAGGGDYLEPGIHDCTIRKCKLTVSQNPKNFGHVFSHIEMVVDATRGLDGGQSLRNWPGQEVSVSADLNGYGGGDLKAWIAQIMNGNPNEVGRPQVEWICGAANPFSATKVRVISKTNAKGTFTHHKFQVLQPGPQLAAMAQAAGALPQAPQQQPAPQQAAPQQYPQQQQQQPPAQAPAYPQAPQQPQGQGQPGYPAQQPYPGQAAPQQQAPYPGSPAPAQYPGAQAQAPAPYPQAGYPGAGYPQQ